jgi:hypothetical protein
MWRSTRTASRHAEHDTESAHSSVIVGNLYWSASIRWDHSGSLTLLSTLESPSLVQHWPRAGTVQSEQWTRFAAIHLGKAVWPPKMAMALTHQSGEELGR